MQKEITIAIISPNNLVCIGLKSILSEFFSCDSVTITNKFEEFLTIETTIQPDLIFLPPDIFVVHDYFQTIRRKVVIMLENKDEGMMAQSSFTFLDINLSQGDIIDSLNNIIRSFVKTQKNDTQEELSSRETEVLKLVALGLMSKQIADMLSISTNTVITHRKNITRKLGINSVSGLTVYALLNGLISSNELEQNKPL
jgi:DNA-binding CsgD family transcriptional regulator